MLVVLSSVTALTAAHASSDPGEKFKVCMSQARNECTDWAGRIAGGDFPRGISINATVELAEGEKYYLDGTISIRGKLVFLNIDFDRQPWLATDLRKAFPYYRIADDDVEAWKKWSGMKVEILVQAKSAYFVNPTEHKIWSEMAIVPLQRPSIAPPKSADAGDDRSCRR